MNKLPIPHTRILILFMGLFLFVFPIFIIIYRLLAYDTLPADPYYEYVMYFQSNNTAFVPTAPRVYRPVYPLLGIFFEWLIPYIPLSRKSAFDPIALKAIQGLSLVSAMSIATYGWICWKELIKSVSTQYPIALATVVVSILLLFQTAFFGIDPLTLLIVLFLLYFRKKKVLFIFGMFLSIPINEKIPFLFALYYSLNWVSQVRINKSYLIYPIIASIAYVLLRITGPYGGHEHQYQVITFAKSFVHSLHHLYSWKGLYLNVLPLAVLFMIFYYSKREIGYLWLMPLILFVIGMFMDMEYTIGRLAMHVLPFYLPNIYQTISNLAPKLT